MIIQKKWLSIFCSEQSLRFDFKYISAFEINNHDFYSYKQLFDFVPNQPIEVNQLESFKYAEIGNVNKLGEIEPIELSFEDRHEENESLFRKIEKGDIFKPLPGDILISKIRPYLNKNVLVNSENIYFTKAFIQIRPKINSELLHILIRTIFIDQLNAVSRQGKGYPTLKEDDIKSIKFPKYLIDIVLSYENDLLRKIGSIKQEISKLKKAKLKTLEILNQVFSSYFNINPQLVEELDKINIISVPIKNIDKYNINLRSGIRWSKMQYIQDILYSNLTCIKTLGKYIKSTKNGWSPVSVEGGEGTAILGQENFSFDGILKIEPSKFTEQTRNNLDNFYIKKGDLFVSRGNTVNLVALASIVNEEIEDNIIFPDLYIRIELDEKNINKEYLSFIFNSFIGRLYFKYVAKGKNQTMVKVSSTELLNFRFPLPSIDQQTIIVKTIKTYLTEQKKIESQIEEMQKRINNIIEDIIELKKI